MYSSEIGHKVRLYIESSWIRIYRIIEDTEYYIIVIQRTMGSYIRCWMQIALVFGTLNAEVLRPKALNEMIRTEIRAGIQEEYGKQVRIMTALTREREESQFNDLLTDLKVLISGYENQVGGYGAPSPFRILSESVNNMTTTLAALTMQQDGRRKPHPESCADLRAMGQTESGVYTIVPKGWARISVYCDMVNDGGGWMVFQRRVNDSIDFYRNWLEYANGFGDLSTSHWLGLRLLHHMTHMDHQEMRVDLADFDGNVRYAKYNFVSVSSEFTKFRLDLGSYSGTAGDALEHSRDHRFSTKDNDNDNHPNEHCSVRYTGGWWYNSCYRANLNGRYLDRHSRRHQGITWNMWLGDTYSLANTAMMMRPTGFQP